MHKRLILTAAVCVLAALTAAGCGSSGSDSSSSTSSSSSSSGSSTTASAITPCVASIGHMGPLTGPAASLGQEQLNWDKFAVDRFNKENGTKFTLVEGDTQLDPAQAAIVARDFLSKDDILATVGPADSASVGAAAPLFERDHFAMVGMSATTADLTNGQYPTFFRVNGAAQQAQTIIDQFKKLGSKKVFIVDDGSVDKVALGDAVEKALKDAGVQTERETVDPTKQTDLSPLASKVDPSFDGLFLDWEVASKAQDLGDKLKQQGSKVAIVGSSGLFSPQFHVDGAFITSFAPDIHSSKKEAGLVKQYEAKYGQFGTFGPPAYAAATVIMTAIDNLCKQGVKPTREGVLDEIKKTDIPDSILGYPLKFNAKGDDPSASFPLFEVKNGKFVEVTS